MFLNIREKHVVHSRREARELAVQFLFQHDLNPLLNFEEALDCFWKMQTDRSFFKRSEVSKRSKASERSKKSKVSKVSKVSKRSKVDPESAIHHFADRLINGVVKHRERLDALISQHARNWDIRRIAVVDRNILRLAIYEMLHRDDIPPVVSINEAVDISKRFSTEKSSRFVNGILDRIKQDIMRPARTAKPLSEF